MVITVVNLKYPISRTTKEKIIKVVADGITEDDHHGWGCSREWGWGSLMMVLLSAGLVVGSLVVVVSGGVVVIIVVVVGVITVVNLTPSAEPQKKKLQQW